MRHGWRLIGAAVVLSGLGGAPAWAQACLYRCDSKCYGSEGWYCRSACMNACMAGQNRGGGTSAPQRSYGAFAATATTGDYWGYEVNAPSRAAAERAAVARCDQQANQMGACKVATWFFGACGALAIGPDGAWGSDWAATTAAASRKALAVCLENDPSKSCHVVKAACTP